MQPVASDVDTESAAESGPGDPLPPPDPGWRYVSWRDVVVQVPESWDYGVAPGPDWCAFDQGGDDPPFPTTPYVADTNPYMATLSIGCPTPDGPRDVAGIWVPERYWAPHLWVEVPDLPGLTRDGAHDLGNGWTILVRQVGTTSVTVLSDAAHLADAQRIVDSARVVETDHNGCDVRSPAQAEEFVRPEPAFDVTTVSGVDSISVCQYDRHSGEGAPGLMGSRLLTGAAADEELAAIQQAPIGGGPDTPETCADDMYGDTAVVLRLHDGDATYDVHAYYDWCFGNGFDDGTNLRELTTAACEPLWEPPVTFVSGSSAPFRRCHG